MGAKASLHMEPMKSFDGAQSNENERRGWDRDRYSRPEDYKGATNHYDWFRKHLNFEIVKGKIVPQLSQSIPLHERLQNRLKELGFKHYKVTSKITPNICMDFMIGGNRERLREMAFGTQTVNFDKPDEKNSQITRCGEIERWAMDTYRWAAKKYGEENIIGFNVHLDETTPHIHMQVIPVGQVTKRGRVKSGEQRGTKKAVSFAAVVGKTKEEYSKYKDNLHTDYHLQVGYKYGLERGTFFEDLSDEEKVLRQHRDKKAYVLYCDMMKKIEEAKKEAAAIVDGAYKEAAAIRQGAEEELLFLQSEVKKAETRMKGLTTMLSNLESQKDNLEAQIAALEDEYTEHNEQYEQKRAEFLAKLAEYEEKITDKQQKLRTAEQKLRDIEGQQQRLTSQNQGIEKKIKGMVDDAIKRHEQTNKAISQKRVELMKLDKSGELARAQKHIEQRDTVIYRRWPDAQAALKAIYERASSMSARKFTQQQALDVEKAISTSGISRNDAANELLSLAMKDFENNRTWHAWVDDTANEVLSIAKGIHVLTPFLHEYSQGGGGGGDSTDLPKKKEDDRNVGYQAMKPKGRK